MQFKPAVTALVAAIALASLLSGCKKEEAAPAPQIPQVGVVTLKTQPFTLTTDLPGRTASYRSAEVRPQEVQDAAAALITHHLKAVLGEQTYVVVQVLPIVKSAYYSNGQHY